MTMNVLDQTIVNVALPVIQRDLHFTQAGLAWVIDAYLITFGGFLLLAGRLGDLIGRKKTFLAGVAMFTVSSAFAGLATTQAMLIGARFAQGAGAAFSASVVLAIIVGEFPDPVERGKATNAYIVVSVGGGSLGLLLGGLLTQVLNWHWIFIVNLPIGVATFIAGVLLIDENEGLGVHAGLDLGGAVLSTGGIMLAIYAIINSASHGWTSPRTLTCGAAAMVMLAGFFLLESRIKAPLMPLRILRSKGLLSTILARGLLAVGMYGTFFLAVLFIEHIVGYNAILTGFAFLPQTLAIAIVTLGPTPWLVKRLRPKPTAFIGFCIAFVGMVLLAISTSGTAYWPALCLGLLCVGAGGAMTFAPLLMIGVAGIPPIDAGLGSGLVNVTQQIWAAVAIAVLGVVSSNQTESLLAHGSSLDHALAGGYRLGFIVGAVSVAFGALVCALVVRTPAHMEPADLAPVVESVEI
jgi:EmrB/QacA subfamily drug resistance transporter